MTLRLKSPRPLALAAVVAASALLTFGSAASSAADTAPDGWFLAGSAPADYLTGIDTKIAHGGKDSAYLASKGESTKGFGTLMQQIVPHEYLGKRVRLTAWVKSEKVADWAGVWMRVDGPAGKSIAFDNMQTRPITGTSDWKKYEVVLDVAPEAVNLAFGILVSGTGRVWMDDLSFEVVPASVPTTERPKEPTPTTPANLNFEK